MKIRALDSGGDWEFGRGLQSYLVDQQAIEENVATRLRQFLGDCFWAVEQGVDWFSLLGVKGPQTQAAIVLAARQVIAESYGIVRINSVEASTDATTRRCTVAYNTDSIFSRSVQGTVTI